MYLLIFFIIFLILLFIGAPIYMSMIIPSIVYCLLNPNLPHLMIIQKLMTALNSFPLMAVPFFILAADIMNSGSITDRIFGFAKAMVGKYRGGLGYVNILSSVIFSGMSGSALADVGGLGQIEIKAMRDAGYDDEFTMGITMASSTVGPIIPPSLPMVVYASFASVSTGALFFGGIIPGLLMSFLLAIQCYFIAKKRNYPREKNITFREKFIAFKKSFLALLMPVIIIGGIWTGKFTATEAAMMAIVYAVILTVFVYRIIKPAQLVKIIINSLNNMFPILFVVAGATLFSFIINYEKVDQYVMNFFINLTDNKYVILFCVNILILVLGMFFDNIVAILLMAPIVQPLCNIYGISMVHIGVVIVFNLMIGLLTPPVGASLYLMASITNYKVSTVIRWVLPWLLPLAATLILITYCDWFVLFLPRLLGFAK
jgi:tripartite ATP-independent transporter DctM subunit